ncbi:hypothetical protein VOLCADRAFT_92300 [Volvox carteri f. nagariensis]|uniref:Uncharacterized protein n=1 Tax=Volvox carteri f. nagariensis TaxID=3068 RepID=D8TZA7_VOLCA|nr:uncharacterized protein VOLCADRAFT_92300 [Volvox carteri f. nagariensis]EFJ47148.1 hypothetical protein VOLCADRAFT_92300 [Volvox carteri f. nagariensis]|eukprot:XP_002951697.1 hypothetical protein VOLCADRAFT_92300 [Volvox carteri f. nagariensis]
MRGRRTGESPATKATNPNTGSSNGNSSDAEARGEGSSSVNSFSSTYGSASSVSLSGAGSADLENCLRTRGEVSGREAAPRAVLSQEEPESFYVVARPSNAPSLGLEAKPTEGFDERPLFEIFKVFHSFEAEGKLMCQVVRLGPQAFAQRPQQTSSGGWASCFHLWSRSAASTSTASALSHEPSMTNGRIVKELTQPCPCQDNDLELELSRSPTPTASSPTPARQQQQQQQQQQQTPKPLKHGKKRSASNPDDCAPPQLRFVTLGSVAEAEALLDQLWRLYEQTGARNGFTECRREQFERLAVVVREGSSNCGPILAMGLLLPQRESLQILYTGMQYDSPLVRQSCCLFQVLSVGLQAAIAHNEAVRQRRNVKAVTATAASTGAWTPPGSAPLLPPPPPLLLGANVGLLDWLDLGPGRRFVKEHLGAVGYPVSLYTRCLTPFSWVLAHFLLNHYFDPKSIVNDP